jgi:hypothetical protein
MYTRLQTGFLCFRKIMNELCKHHMDNRLGIMLFWITGNLYVKNHEKI